MTRFVALFTFVRMNLYQAFFIKSFAAALVAAACFAALIAMPVQGQDYDFRNMGYRAVWGVTQSEEPGYRFGFDSQSAEAQKAAAQYGAQMDSSLRFLDPQKLQDQVQTFAQRQQAPKVMGQFYVKQTYGQNAPELQLKELEEAIRQPASNWTERDTVSLAYNASNLFFGLKTSLEGIVTANRAKIVAGRLGIINGGYGLYSNALKGLLGEEWASGSLVGDAKYIRKQGEKMQSIFLLRAGQFLEAVGTGLEVSGVALNAANSLKGSNVDMMKFGADMMQEGVKGLADWRFKAITERALDAKGESSPWHFFADDNSFNTGYNETGIFSEMQTVRLGYLSRGAEYQPIGGEEYEVTIIELAKICLERSGRWTADDYNKGSHNSKDFAKELRQVYAMLKVNEQFVKAIIYWAERQEEGRQPEAEVVRQFKELVGDIDASNCPDDFRKVFTDWQQAHSRYYEALSTWLKSREESNEFTRFDKDEQYGSALYESYERLDVIVEKYGVVWGRE